MKKFICTATILLICTKILNAQEGLIIQEESLGICTMDGVVESSAEGYTGGGYANIDNGAGIGMSWGFTVGSSGIYAVSWRYALGGSDITSRNARLLLNNVPTSDTVLFPHSGSSSWSEWIYTDTILLSFEAGYNKIHLLSITEKGLPNIDYFHILGVNIEPSECIPSFSFELHSNDPTAGSADYSPKQELYDLGTEISLSATAHAGYFFHSWSGEAASATTAHSFPIQRNTNMTALFYPEGTEAAADANGYATVQHDNGTPYLLNGGGLGDIVQVNSLNDLKAYLEAEEPYVVELGSHIVGENSEEIRIASDKSLIGINEEAHIEGIPVKIEGSRNVIIRNITFSRVVRYDELEINDGAMNIWIDHCNFFTDRDHDVDYYDGLLDIKNRSRFITVSWTTFHDHQKSILISSGDQEVSDSIIRVTFHHNYFYDCESRLPSIRFGKAHIFNNYYRNVNTAINSRMGACVRVENNYFENTGTAVGMLYSPVPGGVELVGNIFNNAGYSEEPECLLDVPYNYLDHLHPADRVPDTVAKGTNGPIIGQLGQIEAESGHLIVYPNPAPGKVTLRFTGNDSRLMEITVCNTHGVPVKVFHKACYQSGLPEKELDLSGFSPGLYILKVQLASDIFCRKLVIR